MDRQPDVLVANEPSVYRDVLAHELPLLRPLCRFHPIEPAAVEDIVTAIRPTLVITSQLTIAIERLARVVIVLYPGGRDEAMIVVSGQEREVLHPSLTDLLAAIDAAVADLDRA